MLLADESITVRAGPILVEASSVEGSVSLSGTPLPGAQLAVDNITQPALFLSWNISPRFAVETLIATPLEADITAGGGLLGSQFKAVEVDVMPFILIGRYNPDWQWLGLKPFAGIGAAYLYFDNPTTTAQFDALGASLGAFDPRIEVNNHWRTVVELGVDYSFDERLFGNFTWVHFKGDTDIAAVFSNGASLTSTVSYAPQIFALTLGYRF